MQSSHESDDIVNSEVTAPILPSFLAPQQQQTSKSFIG
jgi:hypothetical protein